MEKQDLLENYGEFRPDPYDHGDFAQCRTGLPGC
jgi:hypothetical protein